jgi:hypothetical protein
MASSLDAISISIEVFATACTTGPAANATSSKTMMARASLDMISDYSMVPKMSMWPFA